MTDLNRLRMLLETLNIKPERQIGKLKIRLEASDNNCWIVLDDDDKTRESPLEPVIYLPDATAKEVIRDFLDDESILRFYTFITGCPFCGTRKYFDWGEIQCANCHHTLQEMVEFNRKRLVGSVSN